MSELQAIEIAQDSINVLLVISLPLLLIALIVGLVISLFQTLTSIQEMTLTFVPKIIILCIVLLATFPLMGEQMGDYFSRITDLITSLRTE